MQHRSKLTNIDLNVNTKKLLDMINFYMSKSEIRYERIRCTVFKYLSIFAECYYLHIFLQFYQPLMP